MSAPDPYLPFARPVIDDAMIAAVGDTLRTQWIATGPRVPQFEAALSGYLGGRTVRAVSSGTAALELALAVAGVGPGDEVITSPMTFFAVGNAIVRAGATATFVDCDLETRNITAEAIEAAITPRTRAIVATHFGGLPCDMDALLALARRRRVRLIEDAALAIGSRWKGRRVGAVGDITAFSFHPNKNMTTIEGGAIVLENPAEVRVVEELRFHGIRRNPDGTREVERPGGKFNLSDVGARLGLAQLPHLDKWCGRRQALAERYRLRLVRRTRCVLPAPAHAGEPEGHSWNLFCVLLPLGSMALERAQFIAAMHARGIGVGISYEALHLTSLFRARGHREGECPNAERIARETVSLPMHPALSDADVDRVCAALEALT